MRRREFIMLVGGTVAWPVRVRAQQPALPVVALVSLRSAEVRLANAFRKGLDEAGYAEDQNVTVFVQWQQDGNRVVIWPKEVANGKMINPPWIAQN